MTNISLSPFDVAFSKSKLGFDGYQARYDVKPSLVLVVTKLGIAQHQARYDTKPSLLFKIAGAKAEETSFGVNATGV